MDTSSHNITPLMKQYFDIKQQYPHALLLFQVGDFYELFFEDAQRAAAFLAITLTSRGKNNGQAIPLCGVPVHALDYYLAKLVKGGFHVAICDQLEEAIPGKVVKRGVTQVLTPGTLVDSNLLDAKSASYLLSWIPAEDQWGLVFAELLTAQMYATVVPSNSLRSFESELCRFFPDEIIIPDDKKMIKHIADVERMGYFVSVNQFNSDDSAGYEWIKQQGMHTNTIDSHCTIKQALVNFYWYIKRNQERSLAEFRKINFYKPEDFLMLDASTQRNLELIKNNQDGGRANTLFDLLDSAATPMGSRVIKKWIVRPLLNRETIVQRQELVELFLTNNAFRQEVKSIFARIGDIERVVGRIALSRSTIGDYRALLYALYAIVDAQKLLSDFKYNSRIALLFDHQITFASLIQLLDSALNLDDQQDWIIKNGFDKDLDHVRSLVQDSNALLLNLEQQEQKRTGIASLKVRYNQVQGYYIEVTKSNAHLVPQDYIRHQTLVGKERFTTASLKQLEQEIMSARLCMQQREKEVFDQVKQEVAAYVSALRKAAHIVAYLDALLGFAMVSHAYSYVRPYFNDDNRISIKQGKHPVVSRKLGNHFIANDTYMDNNERMFIITGPNMGGKSTYLRQVALIAIMAQCGMFVPAEKAELPLFDRIFTRIGAGDNVAEGKSTFLIEMEETAAICRYATKDSLVILDEVGRGTSTFDGLAIAQAVVEYLYKQVQSFCLFATHYHELTTLHAQYSGITPYYAASKKNGQGMILLYKIIRGTADGSFGIAVARLAQLPQEVIECAEKILEDLTQNAEKNSTSDLPAGDYAGNIQNLKAKISILEATLQEKEAQLSLLNGIDLSETSPKMVFDLIWDWQAKQK